MTVLLCMALLEEVVVVVFYEGVGVTLKRAKKDEVVKGEQVRVRGGGDGLMDGEGKKFREEVELGERRKEEGEGGGWLSRGMWVAHAAS